MAWRQKQWKYKNTTLNHPKKEEIISGFSSGKLLNSNGNHIQASEKFIGFNVDQSGTLAVLPLSAKGRQSDSVFSLHAHSDFVADFQFSPHDACLLTSCSFDGSVKVWTLPEELGPEIVPSPSLSLKVFPGRVDAVLWHPLIDRLLSVGSQTAVKLFDVNTEEEIYSFSDHGDMVQSLAWSPNGSLLATTCRDQKVRIIDPRSEKAVMESPCHLSSRESRSCWLSDNLLLTSGFNSQRNREAFVYDSRNQKLDSYSFDSGSGILIPLYDPDTQMLFLTGKGDSNINLFEAKFEGSFLNQVSSHTVEQVKGACLVPKRSVDAMQGEVNRILVLGKSSITPLVCQVPRRSYIDFHADLFPDTYCGEPTGSCEQWLSKTEGSIGSVSLDPSRTSASKQNGSVRKEKSAVVKPPQGPNTSTAAVQPPTNGNANTSESHPGPTAAVTPEDVVVPDVSVSDPEPGLEPKRVPSAKAFKVTARQSKFKHLEGTPLHKSTHIDNIRNLSISVPGESDGFHANEERCAFPLKGTAGLMAVLEFTKPGKLPDTGVPVLTNGTSVADFAWDPFNSHRLVVGCDNGMLKLWEIPVGGLTETLEEAAETIPAHTDRILLVKFHPSAQDVLASASFDMSVKIWNLNTMETVIALEGHTDSIFCLSWSGDGQRCATHSKDGEIRVYDPRTSSTSIQSGPGPSGTRGARIVWALDDKYIVVSGFDKRSTQIVEIYESKDVTQRIESREIGSSPSLLIPFYDRDSSTLFLTGRGDATVQTFEVAEEAPYLFPLTNYRAISLHQFLSFLPKKSLDVRNVEFARCYRLTQSSVEPISFVMPRIKKEFFQDDLIPPTYETWVPSMTAEEWFGGGTAMPKLVNLKPDGMKPLSEAPKEAPKVVKYDRYDPETFKTDADRKEELVSAVVRKLEMKEEPLPQDLTEGCDSDEWDSD